jgi:hypothetical protein
VGRACADRPCQESDSIELPSAESRSAAGENRASGHPSVSPEEQTKSGTITGDAYKGKDERQSTGRRSLDCVQSKLERESQDVKHKVLWATPALYILRKVISY